MANKIKTHAETPIYFQHGSAPTPPSGSPNVVFTAENLPFGSGQSSDTYDLGAGARSYMYEWRAKVSLPSGAPTTGYNPYYPVEFFICTSDGVFQDGGIGSGNHMLGNPLLLKNLMFIGAAAVDSSINGDGSKTYYTSGLMEVYSRYINIVWWNFSGFTLHGTPGLQEFKLTPMPDEIQDTNV